MPGETAVPSGESEGAQPYLTVEGLEKRFASHGRTAIEGISFSVEQARRAAIH